MAPKKATKAKKEEVIEIPNTATVADGKVNAFIGQWSTSDSIASLTELSKVDNILDDTVSVLPGQYVGDCTVEVRSLLVQGVLEAAAKALVQLDSAAKPKGDAADGADGEENDGGAGGNEEGAGEDGEGGNSNKTSEAIPPAMDRSVWVKGNIEVVAWTPPRPPTPPPQQAETKPETKPGKGGKADPKKKAAAPVEEEVKPVVQEAPKEEPKGAKPETWPTVKFRNIVFEGTVTIRGVHAEFDNCHFVAGDHPGDSSRGNQLQANQYCKLSVANCTFSCPAKAAVYCFPLANVSISRCFFNGIDHWLLQQQREMGDANNTAGLQRDAQGLNLNNVGVMADNAALRLTNSHFANLTTGLLLHDTCAGTQVSKCNFDSIFGTAVFLDKAGGQLQSNTIRRCGHYGLRAQPGTKTKVFQNAVLSQVLVEKGAAPFLHSNELSVHLVDRNDMGGAVYMEATY